MNEKVGTDEGVMFTNLHGGFLLGVSTSGKGASKTEQSNEAHDELSFYSWDGQTQVSHHWPEQN